MNFPPRRTATACWPHDSGGSGGLLRDEQMSRRNNALQLIFSGMNAGSDCRPVLFGPCAGICSIPAAFTGLH